MHKLLYAYIRAGQKSIMLDRGMLFTDFIMATTIPFFIQYIIWSSIYDSQPRQTLIQNYSQAQLLFYYAFALIFGRLNNGYDIIRKGALDIHRGTLDVHLVKPISLILQRFYSFLGESTLYLFPLIAAILCQLVYTFLSGNLLSEEFVVIGILLLLPALQALSFLLSYVFVCLSIRLIKVELLLILQIGFSSVLGGLLFPADFWPENFRLLIKYNPYSFLIALPAELLAKPTLSGFTTLAAGSLFYISILFVFVNWLWPFMLRKYNGAGG